MRAIEAALVAGEEVEEETFVEESGGVPDEGSMALMATSCYTVSKSYTTKSGLWPHPTLFKRGLKVKWCTNGSRPYVIDEWYDEVFYAVDIEWYEPTPTWYDAGWEWRTRSRIDVDSTQIGGWQINVGIYCTQIRTRKYAALYSAGAWCQF